MPNAKVSILLLRLLKGLFGRPLLFTIGSYRREEGDTVEVFVPTSWTIVPINGRQHVIIDPENRCLFFGNFDKILRNCSLEMQ